MAQKVTVTTLDDLSQEPDARTVYFGLDGVQYEIDLADKNESSLRDVLAEYISHARRGGRVAKPAPTTRAVRSAPAVPVRSGNASAEADLRRLVREWAWKNGLKVGVRGRIADDVMAAYDANDPTLARSAQKDAAVPVAEQDAAPSPIAPVFASVGSLDTN